MSKLLLFLLAFLISGVLVSQNNKPFNPVIVWGIAHPIAAIKVKKINKKCLAIYLQPNVKARLDSFNSGGKLDAFRHVFFMSAFNQKIKTKKLRALGMAHERKNYNDFLNESSNSEIGHTCQAMLMDIHNNELAFQISNKELSLDSLKEKVIRSLKNGDAFILKRNKLGSYLDCNGNQILQLNKEKNWMIPICLVPSNYVPKD